MPASRPRPPLVSIIVPVAGDPSPVEGLLAALDAQDHDPARFECVLVDNGCHPPLAPAGQHAFRLQVLRESRPGSYAARNAGVRAARGEVLAFTDADCRPRPDWLSAGVARLATAAAPLVLGGRIESVFAPGAKGAAAWHCLVNELKQRRLVEVFRCAATANMITTRAVVERIGPFDDALYSGGDLEWGRRAAAAGVPLAYCARATVDHVARTTVRELADRARRIAGGHHDVFCRTDAPLPKLAALNARIAFASLARIWRDPRVPNWSLRLVLTAVELRLRGAYAREVLRLWCGARPRRC